MQRQEKRTTLNSYFFNKQRNMNKTDVEKLPIFRQKKEDKLI